MKNRKRLIFRVCAVLLACMTVAGLTIQMNGKTAAAAPMASSLAWAATATGFPDIDDTSGRFINVSRGLETLGDSTPTNVLNVSLQIPGFQASFRTAVFDGELGGLWDLPLTGPWDTMTFKLFPDPTRSGNTAGAPIWTVSSTLLSDNAWSDFPVTFTSPAALGADGNFYYHLVADWDAPVIANESNFFKIAVEGTPFLLAGSTIGFQAHQGGDLMTPGVPVHPPVTYDGTFTFFLLNSNPSATRLDIWDGDADLGGGADTPDFDSPERPNILVSLRPNVDLDFFQVSPFTIDETASNGDPDNPNVRYKVTAPGNLWNYTNLNPSGNLEWERYRIKTDNNSILPLADVTLPPGVPIPVGVYKLEVTNLDAFNNLFIRANFDLFPNEPCKQAIGDLVWNDANGDGDRDLPADEPGIAGVTVELRKSVACDNLYGAAIATAITDANGAYLFSNLDPGCYRVTVVEAGGPLVGMAKTSGTAGTNNNSQSNPYDIDIRVGCNGNLTADFGYVAVTRCLQSIGDTIWQDLDGDGFRDPGEPGIAGVTVNLGLDAACTGSFVDFAGTTTNALGFYQFTGLPAGCFRVQVVNPPGLTKTSGAAGVNDNSQANPYLLDLRNCGGNLTADFGFAAPPCELKFPSIVKARPRASISFIVSNQGSSPATVSVKPLFGSACFTISPGFPQQVTIGPGQSAVFTLNAANCPINASQLPQNTWIVIESSTCPTRQVQVEWVLR